ncbi:uncharacterized protein LOC26528606 isoform X2 [Drosophila mojavensis]|uniref:Uncharacterized protein, isoform B n=1 Tax=Drosophila mojavensis TaxID=7230 RepID=A0A0Q9XB97_DROMO|nr:uncharacterized protein LOC26528606 isoform X2 [Drosophila mojavensis]KRG05461.1 uncharacterized protein Dmoj_GI26820, isoform B [Drosophila mojavensis]
MAAFPGLVLRMVFMLVLSSDAQCVDCETHWSSQCKPNVSGHYCMPGTLISSKGQAYWDEPKTLSQYVNCMPPGYVVGFVHGWCCFWSKKFGCQAAVHPHVYQSGNTFKFCQRCQTLCKCSSATKLLPSNSHNYHTFRYILFILFQILK